MKNTIYNAMGEELKAMLEKALEANVDEDEDGNLEILIEESQEC